jgi:hypothetical protein
MALAQDLRSQDFEICIQTSKGALGQRVRLEVRQAHEETERNVKESFMNCGIWFMPLHRPAKTNRLKEAMENYRL